MNKRRLVLSLAIGSNAGRLGSITLPLMRKYAKKCRADFYCITDRTGNWSPPWEKLRIRHFLEQYDRVLYLDVDCLVNPECPDLFGIVPDGMLGAFNEALLVNRIDAMYQVGYLYGINSLKWDGRYFNTGVMLASRHHRNLFRMPEKPVDHFYEQSYLNMVIALQQPQMFELSHEFNHMTCVRDSLGLPFENGWIAHLAGVPDGSRLLEAERITEYWRTTREKRPRRVLMRIRGGLGDVVAAEPVVRYALTHFYANDDVRISCPWPRVFEHLGVPVVPDEVDPWSDGQGMMILDSKPNIGHPIWSVVTTTLINTTEFASLAMLHRSLLPEERSITLGLVQSDVDEIHRLLGGKRRAAQTVLIHPGRSWESKTFPVKWWQQVVDGIADRGIPVAIIGADNNAGSPTGVLPVKCPSSGTDLRNRLSLGELFAAIAVCPVLVSNDSSPVHIAGAADNWIILIPSAKRPEWVLPYRYGTPWYKARALYKRLTIDEVGQAPHEIHGTSASEPPKQDWNEYLPEPEDVVHNVVEALNDEKTQSDSVESTLECNGQHTVRCRMCGQYSIIGNPAVYPTVT